MNWLPKIRFLFRALFAKRKLDAEMNEEMRSHVEMQTRENIEAGMKPEEARYAALRQFGWTESIKETCRNQRGGKWIEDFFQDLRYGARTLLKNPGFTVVAVLTLALGIGSDTAIFSAVNALVLQPLPYKDSAQITQLLQTDERTGRSSVEISPADFIDLKSQAHAFEAISGWESRGDFVDQGQAAPPSATRVVDNNTNVQHYVNGPLGVKRVAVSADLFTLLGVQPYLGRAVFFAEEAQSPNEKDIILSHRLWQARFGADAAIIGRTVHFGETGYIVVGVLAPDFRFPTEPPAQWQPELFVPLRLSKNGGYRSSSSLHVLGRLKRGMSLEQAQAEVSAEAARLAKDYPESNTNRGMRVVQLRDSLVGQARPALLILFGAVSFVLMIACVNVTNLLLARASARTREIAIRCALGAGRIRLLRLFLTESLLLAGLGGIGAVLFASWLLKLLLALLPENFPRIAPIHIDTWVWGFSSAVALLTALILGNVPALQKSKANLSESLKGNRTLLPGAPRHRFRGGLVIAEVALASVLLVGAGLMTKSYWVLTHTHLGFNPQNVLAVATWPPGSGTARREYYHELFQRVQRLPGVQEVALVDSLPLLGTDAASSIRVPGRPENHEMVGQRSISDDYFHVLQIPIIRGRPFSEQDTETSEKVSAIL